MKLLVTGFNGFVAGSILAQVPKDWEVHGIGRSTIPADGRNIFYHQVDLLDKINLRNSLKKIMPDAVIHTAAIANIDYCEQHKTEAEAINVSATADLANICKEIDTKLVFCSTDAVFDGHKKNYTEDDTPNAINYYASTKIRAEEIVLSASKKNIAARLALVIGLPIMGKGNSFLAEMIEKLKKGEAVKFPANEIRTPVDVITLGAALNELAAGDFGGIIHLSGNTRINRYEMGKQIARKTGFSEEKIIAIDSSDIPGRAPRSNDVSLSNNKARNVLKTPMLSLEEGLELILSGKF
ncbi:MAG: NAD(P)-dependent oxidoreductase [Bacteroidetes bacterium]|nr:NAD(P)-dependent oxidoreductase [Bacteroidota bacterium]